MKKKIILISVILAILIGAIVAYYSFLSINLIGGKEVDLTINNDYFENGYIAKFFNSKINDEDIIITNNIDNKTLGDYEVNYRINYLFPKTVKRIVHVVDNEAPTITLEGSKTVYVNLNEEYIEPGYKAIDNYDGDISKFVKVDGKVDTSKVNKTEITYTVSDEHGNTCNVVRKVEVIDQSILTADVADFSLDGYFDDVKLTYDDIEYDYFKDTVLIGDSNTKYLYYRGATVPAKQIWAKGNLTITQINSGNFYMYENGEGKTYTLDEALSLYRPKYIIANIGIMCALEMSSKDDLVSQVEIFINHMRNDYPDINFALGAILPIAKEGNLSPVCQQYINEYNYYLLETCHKNKVNCVYIAEELIDDEGYGRSDMYEYLAENDKGFHLNQEGREFFIDYVKHLDLQRVID